jgi:hypothetical protein
MKLKTRFNNMDIFERATGFLSLRLDRGILVSLLPLALLFVAWPSNLSARRDEQDPVRASQSQQYIQQASEQLQRLVAPIALYPDSLVAQILAASTFPEQVVEADQWVQAHPDLKGDTLAKAVDQQPWTLASRHSLRSRPSWATWTKTSPGPRLSATLTTTRNKA